MNTQILAKLLLYYRQKYDQTRDNSGSVILMAILLILIIGMCLMMLPSLFGSANKAIESEAKTYVGSMNRAQQAYFLDHQKFSGSLDKLEIGIQSQTQYFNYSIITSKNAVFHYGISRPESLKQGLLYRRKIHDFVGGVFIVPSQQKGELTTLSIMCKNLGTSRKLPEKPMLINGVLTCGEGTIDINNNTKR